MYAGVNLVFGINTMGKMTWSSSVGFSVFQPNGGKTFLEYLYMKQLSFLIPKVILLVEGVNARAIVKVDDVLVGRKVLSAQPNAIKVLLVATSLCHLATSHCHLATSHCHLATSHCHLATSHPCNLSQKKGQGNFP